MALRHHQRALREHGTNPGSDHDAVPELVFDLEFFDHTRTNSSYWGSTLYRSYRVSDLYPLQTPAAPSPNLISSVGDSATPRSQSLVEELGAAMTFLGNDDAGAA